jgi:uncharacterized membrane protein YhaH (DUF805 family)
MPGGPQAGCAWSVCACRQPGQALHTQEKSMNGFDVGKVFSFDGRIGRKAFWQLSLLLFAINLVIYIPVFVVNGSDGLQIVLAVAAIAIYLVIAVASLATTVKRLHDRGKSGWFYLISLIPLIGAIWLLIEVGFLEGQPGDNQYGAPASGSPFRDDVVQTAYGD